MVSPMTGPARGWTHGGRLAFAATATGATIAEDEDRKICTEDLATGPWFGLGAA